MCVGSLCVRPRGVRVCIEYSAGHQCLSAAPCSTRRGAPLNTCLLLPPMGAPDCTGWGCTWGLHSAEASGPIPALHTALHYLHYTLHCTTCTTHRAAPHCTACSRPETRGGRGAEWGRNGGRTGGGMGAEGGWKRGRRGTACRSARAHTAHAGPRAERSGVSIAGHGPQLHLAILQRLHHLAQLLGPKDDRPARLEVLKLERHARPHLPSPTRKAAAWNAFELALHPRCNLVAASLRAD